MLTDEQGAQVFRHIALFKGVRLENVDVAQSGFLDDDFVAVHVVTPFLLYLSFRFRPAGCSWAVYQKPVQG